MKKFAFLFLALNCSVLLHAQNLKITAVMGDEKLSYAYIYINDKVLGVANINGELTVPHNQLHAGDTISASYVGARSAFVVYTKELAGESGYTLALEPDQVLNSVEVTSKFNAWRFFNKNVRRRFMPDWWCEESGRADIKLSGPGSPRTIRTNFFYGIIPTRDMKTETHTRTGITDSSGINHANRVIIYSTIFHSLWRATDAPYMEQEADVNAGLVLRPRGERDGKRLFLIARYAKGIENYQLLLTVDKATKEVESAELELLYGSFNTHLSCKIDFRRQKLSFKNGQNRIAIYPYHIAGTMKFNISGVTSQFELSGIRLKEYNKREQQAIEAERDSHNAPKPVFSREGLFITD